MTIHIPPFVLHWGLRLAIFLAGVVVGFFGGQFMTYLEFQSSIGRAF